VDVQLLAIALAAVYYGRDHDQLALGDEVADAALVLLGLMARVGDDVELERGRDGDEEEEVQPVQSPGGQEVTPRHSSSDQTNWQSGWRVREIDI
jgi:hypothetical protein